METCAERERELFQPLCGVGESAFDRLPYPPGIAMKVYVWEELAHRITSANCRIMPSRFRVHGHPRKALTPTSMRPV